MDSASLLLSATSLFQKEEGDEAMTFAHNSPFLCLLPMAFLS